MLNSILNQAQQKAVLTHDGPILVIAGAGTGKTRVLEHRTFELIKKGIDPKSILLLTFTRRAAAEMLARAARHDRRAQDVSGGTFHSFALATLQRYGKAVGLETFTVLDRGDSEELIGKIISDLRLGSKKYFPKKHTVLNILSKTINKDISVEQILEDEYPHLYEWAQAIELVGINAAKYKRQRNLLDFDDLLYYLHSILEENEMIRSKIHEKYHYIMVDEYQDTNKIQAKIVHQLANGSGNILVVGDEMQSIYRFRGAEFTNMIEFPRLFIKTQQIPLETNYRSTKEILNVANNVLDQVEGEGFKKHLTSDRSGQKPEYHQFKSSRKEAEWIAEKILSSSRNGESLDEIAVLFRAAYQSAPLEIELAARGIPFKKFGGIRFVETAHVKDVLAHLKVVVNHFDELAWRRILLLIDGIGEKSVENIMTRSDLSELKGQTLLEQSGYFKLRPLFELLMKINKEELTSSEKLSEIINYYKPILRSKYDDYPQREQDLDALIELSQPYEKDEDLLNDFALDPPDQSAMEITTADNEYVTLSTVHSAKGLEWGTVFVIQAQEGKFPIVRPESKQVDIEEERRLFYVAVTRAKKRLFITSSHGSMRGFYDSWYMSKMSRFVEPMIESKVVESNLLQESNPWKSPFSKNYSFGSSVSDIPEEDVDEF
ncbi:MAG: ATP-dependent DNA helicase, DNA helicase II / ATP-dependent DNA helicase PcrA [Microgenomates group bacterium GW2011_GWC1_41_8]|uniref:DNA 3'-5' helicase n=2 Tax=Candidatus Roizmaniibacteriota TaxID=1752723 RepID=A0A0G0VHG6_9BACT|nr:MAG: UvrD/REP helicase [Candidatus Roizmanbacteria bacterium GW2011_GWB1_40_7]KKR93301.1 MAG: UvrD/REP helicase [Candidatus Roizmanbacteria bacterium GW2011_GWA1_41_13]KKS23359.1 MAG: ATP-dependent DNA helicase, DNA helicase II / ATP-dependent DNA helicase PcrA [Microgenomates group bacterium GW2011_GWC1_41_8]